MSRRPVAKIEVERNERIRRYVTQMRALLDMRNEANLRIRDLHAEIAKELGIPRNDFIAAMRLHGLATENRTSTVANIGEILRALGDAPLQLTEKLA